MRDKIRGLNQDETYLCKPKEVLAFFKGENIKITFGYVFSRNEEENSKRYLNSYKIRNTKNDRIVSCMFVGKEYYRNGAVSGPYLDIFLLKKKGITDEIREKYLKEVLPEMVRKYKDHNRDDFLQEQSYRLIVVLRDKEFKFYEIIK